MSASFCARRFIFLCLSIVPPPSRLCVPSPSTGAGLLPGRTKGPSRCHPHVVHEATPWRHRGHGERVFFSCWPPSLPTTVCARLRRDRGWRVSFGFPSRRPAPPGPRGPCSPSFLRPAGPMNESLVASHLDISVPARGLPGSVPGAAGPRGSTGTTSRQGLRFLPRSAADVTVAVRSGRRLGQTPCCAEQAPPSKAGGGAREAKRPICYAREGCCPGGATGTGREQPPPLPGAGSSRGARSGRALVTHKRH